LSGREVDILPTWAVTWVQLYAVIVYAYHRHLLLLMLKTSVEV